MSWRNLAEAIWRFVTWRTRINRLLFLGGYFAGAMGGTILAFIVLGLLISMNPQLLAWGPDFRGLWPIFLPMGVYMAGLLAGRAHDCGWPAWPFIALLAVALAVVQVVAGVVFETPSNPIREFVGALPIGALNVTIIGAVGAAWLSMIVLMVTPGQQKENRFGPRARGLLESAPT